MNVRTAYGDESQSNDRRSDSLPDGALRRIGENTYRAAGAFRDVAYSPDGQMVATVVDGGPTEKDAYICDGSTGERRVRLRGHQQSVTCVTYSKCGNVIATGSFDGTIRFWNPRTGEQLRQINVSRDGGVYSIAFSPDGSQLASAGPNELISVWDFRTGKSCFRQGAHSPDSEIVTFSPDGRLLASGGRDGLIRIWDVAGHKELYRISAHENSISSLAFSSDGSRLVSGGSGISDHTVKLWDLSNVGDVLAMQHKSIVMDGHTWIVSDVAFSPDDKLVASASHDGKIGLWEAATGKQIRMLIGHKDQVRSISFVPDGKTLVSGGSDHTLRIWSVAEGRELNEHRGHQHIVTSLAFSPDGSTLASGSPDGSIRMWKSDDGTLVRTADGHVGGVGAFAYSPDGKLLASGEIGFRVARRLQLWETSTAEVVWRVSAHARDINSVAFSVDGKQIASVCDDYRLRIWEGQSGASIDDIELSGMGTAVQFAPDSKDNAVAVLVYKEKIEFWNLKTRKIARTLEKESHRPSCFSFSPNGEYVATGSSYDYTARIWHADSGREVHQLGNVHPMLLNPDQQAIQKATIRIAGHNSPVKCLAYSPRGDYLATGGNDLCIRLWDTKTGQEVLKLSGHEGYIRSVAFSPDGKLFASGSEDTTILVWDVASLCKAKTQ